MKLEEQVVSLELAKMLKRIGVPQDSCFLWLVGDDGFSTIADGDYEGNEEQRYAAFTAAELGELLPSNNSTGKYNGRWTGVYEVLNPRQRQVSESFANTCTEADARAKMLIYLIENKLITEPKEV